ASPHVLSWRCSGHYRFSVAVARPRSPRMVFTRAISLRSPRIFFRLSVCPMLSWNFSLNSWSLSSRSWWRSSSSVKLRTFSDFITFRLSVAKFSARPLALHKHGTQGQLVGGQAHGFGGILPRDPFHLK